MALAVGLRSADDVEAVGLVEPGRFGILFVHIDGQTWYRTADIMSMDADGNLFFVDRTVDTIKAGKLNQLRKENMEMFTKLTWKDLVDGGFVIAGSPDTVAEQMEYLATSLRVGTVFCLMSIGDMPDWKTRYSTQLFAEKVMPRLRNIWPDHDAEQWWCKPLANRVRHEGDDLNHARRHPDTPEGVL